MGLSEVFLRKGQVDSPGTSPLKLAMRTTAIMLAILGFLAGCGSKVDFQTAPVISEVSESISNSDGTLTFKTTIQPTQTAKVPLDLIWIIDNSSSMNEEVEHVRSNFEKFINTVSEKSDLRLALFSLAESPFMGLNPIKLPITGERFLQISRFIGSTEGLGILTYFLCPGQSLENCSYSASCLLPGDCDPVKHAAYSAALKGFLRAESQKAIIMVSDDNSDMSAAQFTQLITPRLPGGKFTFYGFVGPGIDKCPSQYNTGTTYIDLAAQTGGKIFNLCDADWTPSFTDLAQQVLSLSATSFALPHPASQIQILEVRLNDSVLTDKQYSVSASGIQINPEILTAGQTYQVNVHYTLLSGSAGH